MILKIINKFRVLTIFSSKNFLQLKYWSIKLKSTMLPKNLNYCINNFSSNGHFFRWIISSTFWSLYLKLDIFLRLLLFCLFRRFIRFILVIIDWCCTERVFSLKENISLISHKFRLFVRLWNFRGLVVLGMYFVNLISILIKKIHLISEWFRHF